MILRRGFLPNPVKRIQFHIPFVLHSLYLLYTHITAELLRPDLGRFSLAFLGHYFFTEKTHNPVRFISSENECTLR